MKQHPGEEPFFKSVAAMPGHRLSIETGTGSHILFDFTSRLQTARFGALQDEELFCSVTTDGRSLIFQAAGKMSVIVEEDTFLDLLTVDRTRL